MSADSWRKCPKCKGDDTVRIDGLFDYNLHLDGTIEINIRGECNNCGAKYK